MVEDLRRIMVVVTAPSNPLASLRRTDAASPSAKIIRLEHAEPQSMACVRKTVGIHISVSIAWNRLTGETTVTRIPIVSLKVEAKVERRVARRATSGD